MKSLSGVSFTGGVGLTALAALLLISARPEPTDAQLRGAQKSGARPTGATHSPISDPGYMPLRRLSNAEYDATIRDLTGVDLRPTREFPADGAAGEGFTNAAEALSDISPELLAKYFNAAKEIADHAQLLPDGIRFAASKTRRDWTDESTARLRAFYASLPAYSVTNTDTIGPDGKLQFEPYIAATIHHRNEVEAGINLDRVAAAEKLNPRYFALIAKMLAQPDEAAKSYPLNVLRARWRYAGSTDIPTLNAYVTAWQNALWQTVRVGSYIHEEVHQGVKSYAESVSRQVPVDPNPAQTRPLRKTDAPYFEILKQLGQPSADPNKLSDENSVDPTLLAGYAAFRRYFPLFVCFPNVIPNDEVVSLKMFHREDGPLRDLFFEPEQARQIDHLWTEHRFLSRQPVAENNYLPLFIGFVSQDQPKEMLAYFESQRPVFRARAEAFEKEEEAAIPKQWETLLDFASRAYRRPLLPAEKAELRRLYETVRGRGVGHEEALKSVLARVLVSPAFLFHMEMKTGVTAAQTVASKIGESGKSDGTTKEKPSVGTQPVPADDWALASRLSYFLWASCPDEELRHLAATNHLHDPEVLKQQTKRMLKDPRIRALAMEFGTQWINVRDFEGLKEKNERLFPAFDASLRSAIYEESVLFFQSLFQEDRPLTEILDRDDTYLNETLAKHYGVPGVAGPHWRRVEGIHRYGRGGVLGLASVQAKESGASRTSPVLRGNWVSETFLGEKLPRPPANVPKLPEEEGTGTLTLRQQVQQHSRVPACAICHQRIDPYGFALEHYDAIGRYRDKESTGQLVDVKATLKDGTTFEGIEGLRGYLLSKKRDVVSRLFCRRLLGYALGRSVVESDQPLIAKMIQDLTRNGMHSTVAIQTILASPQFRMTIPLSPPASGGK